METLHPRPDTRLRTSWQWLVEERRAVLPGAPTFIKRPFDRAWHYYRCCDTQIVTDQEYERLKAEYIVTYGGWWTIDLTHTRYDGRKWY